MVGLCFCTATDSWASHSSCTLSPLRGRENILAPDWGKGWLFEVEKHLNLFWLRGNNHIGPTLFPLDLKNQTDSSVHSPFTKRQAFTPTSTMMEVFMQDKQPVVTAPATAPPPPSSPLPNKTNPVPQMSPGSSDNQSSSPQPAQQKLKQQKKKASLTSKVWTVEGGRRQCCLRAGAGSVRVTESEAEFKGLS